MKKEKNIKPTPTIVIAGTHSGVGKTTIVTGLIASLAKKGYKVQSFKIGPDYIDTGFHTKASGRESFNLDSWLMPKEGLIEFYNEKSKDAEIVIIEGVMGLFDGGKNGISSTAEIAKAIGAPVILVVDCKAMGQSVGALVKGFVEYDKDLNLAGVIVNRIGTSSHEDIIRETLKNLKIKIIGCIRRNENLFAPARHLGLVPTTEFSSDEYILEACKVITENIDFNKLFDIAKSVKVISLNNEYNKTIKITEKVKIAVAKDEAFSFYYPSSLEILEKMGVEIVPFSPIFDKNLPDDISGIILGGGFPESFLLELEKNKNIREAIYQNAIKGMPIYAECGGYMYLCESIKDFSDKEFKMCGVIPARAIMCKKLQRVGYVTGKLKKDCVFGNIGDQFKGHEFHFSKIESINDYDKAFELYSNRLGKLPDGGYISKDGNVLASYLHLHFLSCIKSVEKFILSCKKYKGEKNE